MKEGVQDRWKELKSVCVKKRRWLAEHTIMSWAEVNKAVSVWLENCLCYLCRFLPLFLSEPFMAVLPHSSPPLPHLANICSAHLHATDPDLQPSVCPPTARKFGCNQTFNRQGSPAGQHVNQYVPTCRHTGTLTIMQTNNSIKENTFLTVLKYHMQD